MSEGAKTPNPQVKLRPLSNLPEHTEDVSVLSGPVGMTPRSELSRMRRLGHAIHDWMNPLPGERGPLLTRRRFFGAIGVAAVVAWWQRKPILGVLEGEGNSQATPAATSQTAVQTEATNNFMSAEIDQPIPEPLYLEELVEILEAENIDDSAVTDRIEAYNKAHPDHQTTTLDADENRKYNKTEGRIVFGIYQALPSATIRNFPRDDNAENIAHDEPLTKNEIDNMFDEGFFLGHDVMGSLYDGELGSAEFVGDDHVLEYAGIWVSIDTAKKDENGVWHIKPNDALATENSAESPAMPAIAAGFGIRAVSLEEARAELKRRAPQSE